MKSLLLLASCTLFFGSFSAQAAKDSNTCREQTKKLVDSCDDKIGDVVTESNAAAEAVGKSCGDSLKICNKGSAAAQKQTAIDLADAKARCEKEDKPKCDEFCLGKDLQNCRTAITSSENAADAGSTQAGEAAPKTGNSADKAGSDKHASNSGGMPPMSIPPTPQQQSNNTPTTQTADNSQSSTPAATPASTPTQQSADKQTGKAGFQTAAKNTNNPCGTLNTSEISGCGANTTAAPVQAATAVTPFGSNAYASGGGGGASTGSSGGGLAAAAAALSNGAKLPGETEKDGKNSGIKAASLNIGTDGGGGGGSDGGGSERNYDLDFSSLKQPMRNPASSASALNKATPASATGPLSQVGAQRVSVTKIVTDVYVDRCNAGRFLHCGNNK